MGQAARRTYVRVCALKPVPARAEHLGPHKLINKNEFIRLLEQALYKLGFAAVAKQLEAASVRARVTATARTAGSAAVS